MGTIMDYLRNLRKQDCTLCIGEAGLITLVRALGKERIYDLRIVGNDTEGADYRVEFRASERQWNSIMAFLRGADVSMKTVSKDQFGRIYLREL